MSSPPNGLAEEIDRLAATRSTIEDYEGVENITGQIRALIEDATIPADLDDEIRRHIAELTSDGALVAVRSSVALKDTPISSFPGMMDTYHYIKGADEILRHVRMCWASVWTARAAFNRLHHDIDYHLALIAPVVQRMVDADIAGIMFTANPMTGSRDEIVIESNWGLGESVVSGKSMNDFFVLAKADLSVITRRIARKTVYMCFDEEQGAGRKEMVCTAEMSEQPTLEDDAVHALGEMGLRIESWFGQPQDIEWAYEDGELVHPAEPQRQEPQGGLSWPPLPPPPGVVFDVKWVGFDFGQCIMEPGGLRTPLVIGDIYKELGRPELAAERMHRYRVLKEKYGTLLQHQRGAPRRDLPLRARGRPGRHRAVQPQGTGVP